VWGGLHGLYLLVAHAWRAAAERVGVRGRAGLLGRAAGRILTFLAVVVAWVFFRAESFGSAWTLLRGMAGLYGFVPPGDWIPRAAQLLALLVLVWWAPNTQSILARYEPALMPPGLRLEAPAWLCWRPTPAFALAAALLTVWGVLGINRYSEFLYFQF
jgi:hypothetical protein